MDDPRLNASVPGDVICLKCNKPFRSPDRRSIRICQKCKRDQERLGWIAEHISGTDGADQQDSVSVSYGNGTGFPIPPPTCPARPVRPVPKIKSKTKAHRVTDVAKPLPAAAKLSARIPKSTTEAAESLPTADELFDYI